MCQQSHRIHPLRSAREEQRSKAPLLALISLLSLTLNTGLSSTPRSDTSAASDPQEQMEEVVVTGLRQLKQAAIKAEDRMLARYNELNRDRDLDIVCSTRTPTGTRLTQRYCKLRLQQRVEERDAWSAMTAMTRQDIQAGAGGATPAPTPLAEVRVELMARADDFRENVEKLLSNNPDLRELVHQSALARRRYEDRLTRLKDDDRPPK